MHYDHDEPKAPNDEPQRRIVVVAAGIQYLAAADLELLAVSQVRTVDTVLKMIVGRTGREGGLRPCQDLVVTPGRHLRNLSDGRGMP